MPSSSAAHLTRLSLFVTPSRCCHAQVEVCYLNSKGTRKKLVRALFAVPRTALELVPYYARLAAILASVMKDVAPMLLAMLEEEFNYLLPKKVRGQVLEAPSRGFRVSGPSRRIKSVGRLESEIRSTSRSIIITRTFVFPLDKLVVSAQT